MGVPLDGRRFGKPRYAWTTAGASRVHQSWRATLLRAWRSRRLAAQGAERQRSLLSSAAALAESYAPLLGWDVTHVVVAQNLLPFLWRQAHEEHGMEGPATSKFHGYLFPQSRSA